MTTGFYADMVIEFYTLHLTTGFYADIVFEFCTLHLTTRFYADMVIEFYTVHLTTGFYADHYTVLEVRSACCRDVNKQEINKQFFFLHRYNVYTSSEPIHPEAPLGVLQGRQEQRHKQTSSSTNKK